jgi:hypothetical protein
MPANGSEPAGNTTPAKPGGARRGIPASVSAMLVQSEVVSQGRKLQKKIKCVFYYMQILPQERQILLKKYCLFSK